MRVAAESWKAPSARTALAGAGVRVRPELSRAWTPDAAARTIAERAAVRSGVMITRPRGKSATVAASQKSGRDNQAAPPQLQACGQEGICRGRRGRGGSSADPEP